MTEDEIVARADADYHHVWSLFGTLHAGGEAREADGLLCVSTDIRVAMFNNAFVQRPLPEPERQIAEAAAFFDERKMPFCVRIREGLDPAAEKACEALGLPYSDTVPGMALTDMSKRGPAVDGLEIRTASSDAEFEEHLRIMSEVYEFSDEICHKLYSPEMLHTLDSEYYVGYVDGAPVASALLVLTGRTAGIYNIATVGTHRKRGIGEAVTWHCVERGAAMGCVIATLQASEMGRPVYERMGFRTVAPYRTFHRPGV